MDKVLENKPIILMLGSENVDKEPWMRNSTGTISSVQGCHLWLDYVRHTPGTLIKKVQFKYYIIQFIGN